MDSGRSGAASEDFKIFQFFQFRSEGEVGGGPSGRSSAVPLLTSRCHSVLCALLVPAPPARRSAPLPQVDGVGVLHDGPVHPGEGVWQQHGTLEEAHVAAVLGQGEHHVGRLFYGQTAITVQMKFFKVLVIQI